MHLACKALQILPVVQWDTCRQTYFVSGEFIVAVKVAINGFGRIGRLVFRAMVEQGIVGKDVQVVAVGDLAVSYTHLTLPTTPYV